MWFAILGHWSVQLNWLPIFMIMRNCHIIPIMKVSKSEVFFFHRQSLEVGEVVVNPGGYMDNEDH